MKVGIDSYCYHRFFGEVYPRQTAPPTRMTLEQFIDRAHELGVDGVSLESCFIDRKDDAGYLESVGHRLDQYGLDRVYAWGHPGGPGDPHAQRVGQIRSVLLDAVTDDDVRAIVKALIDEAKTGDVRAAAELFNRLIGRPGDASVQVESAGVQHVPLQTTPERALAALNEAAKLGCDPYCGDRPDDASCTGGSA